jgi:hypothetical protein
MTWSGMRSIAVSSVVSKKRCFISILSIVDASFINITDRYPNHKESKRIDEEHKEEIEKLRSEDGDFHHGFNTGLLAAARMFREKADVVHINKFQELTPDLLAEASKHKQRILQARGNFPQIEVTNEFPKQD